MKKTLKTLMFPFVIGLLGLSSSAVLAEWESPVNHVSDRMCSCGTCAAELGYPYALITYNSRAIWRTDGTGYFYCKFDIPAGYEPAKSSVIQDPGCYTPFGLANTSRVYLKTNGKAKLVCQVNSLAEEELQAE